MSECEKSPTNDGFHLPWIAVLLGNILQDVGFNTTCMTTEFYLFCCYCEIIPSIQVMVEEVEDELDRGRLALEGE